MTNKYPKMTRLARTFPCMARGGTKETSPGVAPFDALMLERESATWSHGERAVADFILSVFDPGQWPFDMHAAMRLWGAEYRAAFIVWAAEPWWG